MQDHVLNEAADTAELDLLRFLRLLGLRSLGELDGAEASSVGGAASHEPE